MRKLIATFVLSMAILAGCSSVTTSGTVIDKWYEAPYDDTEMECWYYNSQGFCSMYLPVTYHYNEKYVLQLQNGDDTGEVEVSPQDFIKTPIGSVWGDPSPKA